MEIAWLLQPPAFECGQPRAGVTLGEEAVCSWGNSWRLTAPKLSANDHCSSWAESFIEGGSWLIIQWGMWLPAILGLHSYNFPLKGRKKRSSFFSCLQIPGKDSSLSWITYLFLGPVIWPGVRTMMGTFLALCSLVSSWVFRRGLGWQPPQNPTESGKSIFPTKGLVAL